MPWHHQLDLKFLQDFYFNVGGKRNTLQLGIDIENLPNLLSSKWGLYKEVEAAYPLTYNTSKATFNFPKSLSSVRTTAYSNYADLQSTYRIQFSLRYIFN